MFKKIINLMSVDNLLAEVIKKIYPTSKLTPVDYGYEINKIVIDPTNMNELEQQMLGDILFQALQLPQNNLISPQDYYTMTQSKDNKIYTINHVHSLYPLLIYNQQKTGLETSFEILGDKIGSGSHGITINSRGRIKLKMDNEKILAIYVKRPIENEKVIKQSPQDLAPEYEKSIKFDYLKVKPAIKINDWSFLKSKKMPGVTFDLFEFLKLDLLTRLQFCITLIEAYKKQIMDKGMSHGDLRGGSNFLVKTDDNQKFIINFIDMEYSDSRDNKRNLAFDVLCLVELISSLLNKIEPFDQSNRAKGISLYHELAQIFTSLSELDNVTKASYIQFEASIEKKDLREIQKDFKELITSFMKWHSESFKPSI